MKLKFLFLFFVIFLLGCSNETEDLEYYVKYEVYMPSGWPGQTTTREITFVNVDGEQTISTPRSSWEGTYGPFKKKDRVYLKALTNAPVGKDVETYVRIYVSRDKEPFVIKGEERGKAQSSLYTQCVINF